MRKVMVTAAVGAVLAAMVGFGGTASARNVPHKAAAPSGCFKTFTSGANASFFQWCFSNTGNVVSIQSPQTFEHIHVGTTMEGYAVCSGTGAVYDYGQGTGGFGSASFTAPNKITRSSNDGKVKLVQTFTQNTTERQIFVNMTVTNTSGKTLTNLQVSRVFDGDIDGTSNNDVYVRTNASVIGTDKHGLELTAGSFTVNHTTTIERIGELEEENGCLPKIPQTSPTNPGDFAGRANYEIGNLGAGASVTVKFRYSVM